MDALHAGLIPGVLAYVAHVLEWLGRPKIDDPVIGFVEIYVVKIEWRPLAVEVQPCKTVS